MSLKSLLIQVLIALACTGIATIIVPRRVPGRLLGMALIGFAGVWLGESTLSYVYDTYDWPIPSFMTWDVQGILIVPAILGSVTVLYVVTTFLSWGRYRR